MLLPSFECPSGRNDDLERPGNAHRVRRVQSICGLRVQFKQPLTILLDTCFANLPANGLVDWRNGRDAVEQGPQIKAGPANENREPASRMNIGNLSTRHLRPVGGGAGPRSVQHTVQPVLGTRQLVRTGGRAQDWEVAIDLRAVGVDDDTANLLCKTKRQCRLAARGRPSN